MKIIFVSVSRNIANNDELSQFIKKQQELTSNSRIKKFLASTLRLYLIQKGSAEKYRAKLNDPDYLKDPTNPAYRLKLKSTKLTAVITDVDPATNKKAKLVVKEELEDAIRTMIAYLEENESHCNLSIPDVFRRASQRAHNLREKQKDLEGHVKVLRQYKTGFAWTDLLDDQALAREGKIMKHCVGDEAQDYRNNVRVGLVRIIIKVPHCKFVIDLKN